MDRSQPTERAIYVPKGRRELNATVTSITTSAIKPVEQLRDLKSKKRPAQEEEETDNSVNSTTRNSKPARSEVALEEKKPMETSQNKPKPVPRETGIYIPRGRRALNEQKTVEEPAKAASSAPPATVQKSKSEAISPTVFNTIKEVPTSSSKSATAAEPNQSPTDESVALSNLEIGSNATNKPKEVVRGIYIPKGRRELNEKKALDVPQPTITRAAVSSSDEGNGKSESHSNAPRSWDEDGECSAPSKAKLAPYTNWDDASSEEEEDFIPFSRTEQVTLPPPPSLEETVAASSLLLTGVPAEMSDMAKGNIVRAYLDKGASVKWVSVGECVIVFKSEKAAVSAIPGPGTSIFRVVRVRDISQPRKDELVSVAKEFFTVTKPERDNTVANRLIGAALGIRITSTKAASTDLASKKNRAPSPPREDAWDD